MKVIKRAACLRELAEGGGEKEAASTCSNTSFHTETQKQSVTDTQAASVAACENQKKKNLNSFNLHAFLVSQTLHSVNH